MDQFEFIEWLVQWLFQQEDFEFDWDPNAPGGVPGFDPWPTHDPRVAEASPRN